MSDLLAEVDEMMRRERMEKLWQQHGKLILGLLALLILATALWSGYKSWNRSVMADQTAALVALIDGDAFPASLETADLGLRGGPKGIALLTGAGAYLQDGKRAEALALYQRAADDSAIARPLRQLALLMSVRLLAADGGDPDTLLGHLGTIWNDSGSPWRFHARVDAAALLADAKSDLDGARAHLAALQDSQGLPDTLYQRVRALDHIYALRQQQTAQQPATP